MIRLGLQTITWGDPQDHLGESIFRVAEEAGYDGVEIGWRRFKKMGGKKLMDLSRRYDIALIASHAGGNLIDLDQADRERQEADEILETLEDVGVTRLNYSGLRYEDGTQFQRDLAALNALAKRSSERGIQLLYHNHDWEFFDGQRIFKALRDETTEELMFCPDVGWIHKGGADCLEVLESIRERVGALHYKDFRTPEPGRQDFCCLGNGCVPFGEISRWARNLDRDELWVIAEQDEPVGTPEETVRTNSQFMKTCFDRRGRDNG